MVVETRKKNVFQIMGPEGDEEFDWDADSPEDVENAREKFKKLIGKGYIAYKRVAAGKGEQVRTFDPLVERVIFTPPMRGG